MWPSELIETQNIIVGSLGKREKKYEHLKKTNTCCRLNLTVDETDKFDMSISRIQFLNKIFDCNYKGLEIEKKNKERMVFCIRFLYFEFSWYRTQSLKQTVTLVNVLCVTSRTFNGLVGVNPALVRCHPGVSVGVVPVTVSNHPGCNAHQFIANSGWSTRISLKANNHK